MPRRPPLAPEEYLGLRLAVASSFAGFVLAGVLVLNHIHAADAAFCAVGEWASCNAVNRSAYSEVLGVPVALAGMFGFLALACLATARLASPRKGLGRLAPRLMSATGAVGLAAGAYLTFIELFVLQAVCLLCVAALAAFVAALVALRRSLAVPEALRRGRGRREKPANRSLGADGGPSRRGHEQQKILD